MQCWTVSARPLPDVGGDGDVDVPPGYQLFKVQTNRGNQVDLEHVNWVGILPAVSPRDHSSHNLVDLHIEDKAHVNGVGSDSASVQTNAQENWH